MKTHRFDSLSFLAGLVMAVIGLAFLVYPRFGDLIDAITDAGAWFWPVAFIAVGIAILAPMAMGRREPADAAGLDNEAEDEESEIPDGD
jgi:hypothetical protein